MVLNIQNRPNTWSQPDTWQVPPSRTIAGDLAQFALLESNESCGQTKALEQNQHRNMDLKRVDMVDHKSAVPSAIGIMEILPATATTRPKT